MSSDLPGDPPLPGAAPPPEPTPDPATQQVPDGSADPVPSPVEPPPVADEPPPPPEPMPAADPPVAPEPPPPAADPQPVSVEPPPPAVVATGIVTETRDTVIIIRQGIAPGEQAYPVNAGHDAMPGHAITIYADGTVVLGNYTAPMPSIPVPSVPRVE